MFRNGLRYLPAITIFVLASPRPYDNRHPAGFKLQLESLSRVPPDVHVTASIRDFRRAARVVLDTVVAPPAVVEIADSITSIHVVVQGFRSVRATLTSAEGDSLVSEGRDITLSRAPGGRFARVWTFQPLVP